jgi:hypothetical protein
MLSLLTGSLRIGVGSFQRLLNVVFEDAFILLSLELIIETSNRISFGLETLNGVGIGRDLIGTNGLLSRDDSK